MRTLFVVGAGASVDFGLPVGTRLAFRIAELASGSELTGNDFTVADLVRHNYGHDRPECDRRLVSLDDIAARVTTASSIDRFIDRERHDPLTAELGKVLIVAAIAEAERNSKLFSKRGWEASRSWCQKLVELILENAYADKQEDIGRNVSIVCFNYDRCLEFYLVNALALALKIDQRAAANIVQQIEIIHPYGTIGDLPGFHKEGNPIEFGRMDFRGRALWTQSNSISTFTEAIDEGKKLEIGKMVASADQIFFLGFAYYKQNMDLLSPGVVTARKRVFGSAFQIGIYNQDTIIQSIRKVLGAPGAGEHDILLMLDSMDCVDAIDAHWYALLASAS